MKTECDYLYGWIEKAVTYAEILPKMANPKDIAGESRRRSPDLRLSKLMTYKLEATEAASVYEVMATRILLLVVAVVVSLLLLLLLSSSS